MLVALFLASITTPQAAAEPEAAPSAAPPPLLLRGATVHSLLPGDAPRVADVLIEEGRIRAVGPGAASASEPRVLELSGKHLVPGLIDAHVNFDPEHDVLYLAAGVTLVRDQGGDHFMLQRERAPARRDGVPGPALLTAGAALDGDPPAAATAVVLRSPDAAESYLPILFEENVDFLSVLPGLPEASWRKVLELAHARELTVFGPRPAKLSLSAALSAGQDGFHALDSLLPVGVFWDSVTESALDAEIAALSRAGKPLVPLLHASALRLEDQSTDPARAALIGLLAPSYEGWWRHELEQRKPFLAPESKKLGELVLEKQARALLALHDAGARLLPGSGAPQPWCLPGTALHQELLEWTRAGLAPSVVLELATRGAAEALGLAGQRGTLAAGAWADVLVLDQDPREDLAHLLDPAWVIVRGRALSRADIEARLKGLGERQAARRAELATPLVVEPPPQDVEGQLLLEGTVESYALGLRLSAERYRVVRIDDEVLLYTARVVHPRGPTGSGRELTVEQLVRKGRLEQAHAVVKEDGKMLEYDGLWRANTWRMQTRLDGKLVSSPPPFREQPVCVDAGSVTSLLVLGQTPATEILPVVQLHAALEAEPVHWSLAVDADGTQRVRTQIGFKVFRLDEAGAVEMAFSKIGAGLVETRKLASSAFGGAGLPLPAEKLRRAASTGSGPVEKPGG